MINFVLALFHQIMYVTIIATVVGYVILLLKKVIRKRLSPNANYLIWLVFFMALIFPISIPSAISIYNYVDISNVKYGNNKESDKILNLWKEENDTSVEQDAIEGINNNNYKIWKNYIEIGVVFVWLIGFMIALRIRISSYLAVSRGVGDTNVTDERILLLLEKCKRRLNITKDIKMVNQEIAVRPATIGVFNVKILVTDFFLELDDVALSGIFLHELSHYKRKDNVMNFIILILKLVYWFNIFLFPIFKSIRNDMELATDEIAVGKMNSEELRVYCKSMIAFSTNNYRETEAILGLSTHKKTLEKRISIILLKENFEKNAKVILMATFFIILLMCLIFYPSSYGMNKIPRLYLKLKNGSKVEATRIENEDVSNINEIKLTEKEEIKLIVKNKKPNDYIFYSKLSLDHMELDEEINNIPFWELSYFENGQYIYNFILLYGDNQTVNYAIKIIVE